MVTVGSGIAGAIAGVAAIWLLEVKGIIVLVLAPPMAALVLGLVYLQFGSASGPSLRYSELLSEWRVLARLGLPIMLSGVVAALGPLLGRVLIQRELGTEAVGQFQAAWAIGMTYLGFVLQAMATDYYPRLSAKIDDHAAASQLVNEQTEVALLLCAPVLLFLLGSAPWVMSLLYSTEFEPAVEILRWQLLGDVLKVVSFPLGFVLLAKGAGRTFVMAETFATAAFLIALAALLPIVGVLASGLAFLAMYGLYLPFIWWLGRRSMSFRWSKAVKAEIVIVLLAAVFVEVTSRHDDTFGLVVGCILSTLMMAWAVIRLSEKAGATGRLGKVARIASSLRIRLSARKRG